MKALAKVNLFLHVTGRAENGYHFVESMVAFTEDLFDEIELLSTDENGIDYSGEFSAGLIYEKDLVTKAKQLLGKDDQHKFHFKLVKNIPSEAGIGGGSSDAAVSLKLMQEHISYKGNLDELCMKIGADVVCCYRQKACYFYGFGEKIKEFESFPEIYAVLVNNREKVPTKNIYSNFGNNFSSSVIPFPLKFTSRDELFAYLATKQNDLYRVSLNQNPSLSEVIANIELTKNVKIARMSGSGGTCFGLYVSRKEAEDAAYMLKQKFPRWFIVASKLA